MKSFDASRLCSGLIAVLIPFCLLTFRPQSVEAAPITIYAGTGAGVFKSTDGGMNWVSSGLTSFGVAALAIDPTNPSTLYAGTGSGGGVFKSTDGGESWIPVNDGLELSSFPSHGVSGVSDIVIDPINPFTLYAGTSSFGDGIFKSTNGAMNWAAMNTGLEKQVGNLDVRALAIHPVDPMTLYVTGATGFGFWKSLNGGGSWFPLLPGSGFALAIDPANPATVYAAGPNGISKSTDDGFRWNLIVIGLTNTFVKVIVIDPDNTNTLYVGTPGETGGVFKSTDGGALWVPVNSGLVGIGEVGALVIDPTDTGTVFAGTDVGVFKTTNGGVNWAAVNSGLPNTRIGALVAVDGPPPPVVTPVFTAASITNGASFVAGVSAGSIVTIFGTGLTTDVTGVVLPEELPLPTQLRGTSVTLSGIAAPLFAIANVDGQGQINLQVPYELTGQATATVVVNNDGVSSDPVEVNILPAHPGVFTVDGTTGAILHASDFRLVSPADPAAPGEAVLVYATGLGPVSPAPATGAPASASPLSFTAIAPVVTVGGMVADVLFSGLAPEFVGLYQVNVEVPTGVPSGAAQPVEIIINGVTSNTVTIAVE